MYTRRIRRRQVSEPDHSLPSDWHPVLRRVYAARGVTDAAHLDPALAGLSPPQGLTNLDAATRLLADQVTAGGRILIVGDFDADGATSCAVALRALRAFGAADVDYLVPNRFDYGYGLSPEIVHVARRRQPDLIVTVDNGISSLRGVAAAREAGIRVVVTDHHLPGAELPAADAIVNPNLVGDGFPSKALAGVGVTFYVMLALRSLLRAMGWFEHGERREPNLAEYLDLVALGTVADVVPLDRNNRILVEQGLRRLRAGQACPGIGALLDVAGRDHRRLVAADLGFALGPRLNAAGRLEDMSLGIECLLADDPGEAHAMAQTLDDLNRRRREIEARMKAQALAELDRLAEQWRGADPPLGFCLFDDGWHQGVIGILASRIKERFNRPVVAFAPSGDGELKGSARSVPGLHMRDLLERVDSQRPGLIGKFGGHAMAAGLSLRREAFEDFRDAFQAAIEEVVDAERLEGVMVTDGALSPADFDLGLAEALRRGGPWGQGFPEPLFDGLFAVAGRRVVGDNHLKLRLTHPSGEGTLEAIAFNALEAGWDRLGERVQLVYRLDANEFRGQRTLQLVVEYMESAD